MSSIQNRAAAARLLALDVDGILTDGRIYYGNDGEELKAFNIKDGLGLKLLQDCGVKVAIITGRQSEIVARRARELGIEEIVQGRDDKLSALLELCQRLDIAMEECIYMGDDLPDLGAVIAAGVGMTVSDGAAAVRQAADWISKAAGGDGAVREACEFILTARGDWAALEAGYAQ